MKKLQLRVFQALVIVMLALGSFALTSCNDDDDDALPVVAVNGINYILNSDNTCAVTVGNYTGAVSIPGGIEYGEKRYQVTTIANGAFMACTELTAVEIPNTVTYIDAHAFDGCANLTKVEFPANLTFIGNYAFNNCALTEVEFPDALASVGAYSFAGNKIKEVTLGKNMTLISWCAFKECPIEYIYATSATAPVLNFYSETEEWPFDAKVLADALLVFPSTFREDQIISFIDNDGWIIFYNNNHIAQPKE